MEGIYLAQERAVPFFRRTSLGNRAPCTQYCKELLCQRSQAQTAQYEIHFNSVTCLNLLAPELFF